MFNRNNRESDTEQSAISVGSLRYLETIVGELRTSLSELRQEIRAASTLAATAQGQISAHTAVCEERQRQMEVRQSERDHWHEDQALVLRKFMSESSNDRASLREELIKSSQLARTELRDWSIRVLVVVAGANLIGAALTVGSIMKVSGLH